MGVSKEIVCVGLCTYRRPGMLQKALNSFAKVELPEGVRTILLVSDNEEGNEENLEIFETFRTSVPFECRFLQEPRKGFTNNRNKLIDTSIELGAHYLMIFDDDQTLDTNWMKELLACRQQYDATAVRGKVVYNYPKNMQMSSDIFEVFNNRKVYRTGDLLETSGDGNSLLDVQFLKKHSLRLNERYNDVGGSDALMFYQMADLGGKLVYCEEAISYEEVPESRATDQWALQRMFRAGYTRYLMQKHRLGTGRALHKNLSFWIKRRWRYFFDKLGHRVSTGQLAVDKAYLDGILAAILGRSFSEYDQIHGY